MSEFEIPLPWDVMDANTIVCLPGYAPGFVDFTHEVITAGLSVFKLSQAQLGDLGEITLRKATGITSIVDVGNPPRPDKNDIVKYWNKKLASPDREEFAESSKENRARGEELLRRKRSHQNQVGQAYFSRLVQEVSIWKDNDVYPPIYILAWVVALQFLANGIIVEIENENHAMTGTSNRRRRRQGAEIKD